MDDGSVYNQDEHGDVFNVVIGSNSNRMSFVREVKPKQLDWMERDQLGIPWSFESEPPVPELKTDEGTALFVIRF